MTDERDPNAEAEQPEPPQLQIWEGQPRETEVGHLVHDGESWRVAVTVERTAPDLCRGRLSFRFGDRLFETEPVILEETEAAVVSRAAELPPSTLRQFLDGFLG